MWVTHHFWIIQIIFVVFVALLLHVLEGWIFRRWTAQGENTKTIWNNAWVLGIHQPLRALIGLAALCVVSTIARPHVPSPWLLGWITSFQEIGIIALCTWALVRVISQAEQAFVVGKTGVDRSTFEAIGRLSRIFVVLSATLIALQALGYPISGLLALGGAGTLIAGFAAKDLLANFFGGLMIYLDRPFAKGDWVRSPDREIEGIVDHIGWRLTRILTLDHRPLYVPNAVFANIIVENPSRMSNRQIKEHIRLRSEDASKMPDILKDIRQMISQHVGIDHRRLTYVYFVQFEEGALAFLVQTSTRSTQYAEYLKIQEEIFFNIVKIIEAHGAEMASATRTVHIPKAIKITQGENGK